MARCAIVLVMFLLVSVSVSAGDVERARELYDEGRLADARALAEQILKDDPTSVHAHEILGRVAFDSCRLQDALKHLRRAAELDERWSVTLAGSEARICYFYGDDEGARALLPRMNPEWWDYRQLKYLLDDSPLANPVRSKHYLVYTDDALRVKGGHEFASRLLELIDKAYRKVFPFDSDPKVVSRVFLFSGLAGFQAFCQGVLEKNGVDALGFYSPAFRLLIIRCDGDRLPTNEYGFSDSVIETVFHEAFHQFIHKHVPSPPDWFNEGLADYFGPSRQVKRDQLAVGLVQKRSSDGSVTRYQKIVRVVKGEDSYRHYPLETFLTLSYEDFHREPYEYQNYSQGWSLIHFLLHAPSMKGKGEKLLKDYFQILREGRSQREAHDATFGKLDLSRLEKAWIEYVKGL